MSVNENVCISLIEFPDKAPVPECGNERLVGGSVKCLWTTGKEHFCMEYTFENCVLYIMQINNYKVVSANRKNPCQELDINGK